MITYRNYYGTEKDDTQYEMIAESNVIKFLGEAFGVNDITSANVNLADEAYEYVSETLGLSVDEISALKNNLK